MNIRNRAFTLIELLVVIAIIGILAAVIIASLNGARSKARDAKRISELKQVQLALEMYRNENPTYPIGNFNSASGWNNFVTTYLINPGYLSSIPQDPNGTALYRLYSNYSGTYTCRGVVWQNYEYVITFNLENSNSNVPITNWSGNTHCLPGPLKN